MSIGNLRALITSELNTVEFQRDLRRLAATTSRTLPEFLNSRGYTIARRAMDATRRASRTAIEALGVAAYRLIRSRKTGLLRRGRPIYEPHARALAIVASRERARGRLENLPQAELRARAEKLIGARLRSIAFLASGWIPALRKLDRYGAKGIATDARQKGSPKGRAIRAVNGWNPFVQIENNATPEGGNRGPAEAEMTAALRTSMAAEHAEMRQRLAGKLKAEFKALGATVT